jgi:hypothetical protein
MLVGAAPGRPQAESDGRVEMPARDVADGIGHGEHRQAKGERDAHKTDAKLREASRDHGAAAPAEHQPEGAQELRRQPALHIVLHRLSLVVECR